ncbi:substrate import-associated zinc metallohydrolase lipoprotein [Dysgonomonas sp. PFB1-18]|uniref:zinc-binding metallopeptidase n=1 Tax=unclassified Dysgonomonas TaxID=2630389 RepID=UPI0024761C25|nr:MULTISPECIES: putative zinc-binding metallopeptidase [unclassified Dysgonomonas]MDL2302950.1 putative zinc-binding metallopeptidase [Dysgonomonas sp. OttesenSCG-928-D17]MDH6309832.1 substrate import-associated zinc metallohydrolase lipoprotein [Dysgonomonas sp. PF1-14]MDH6339376.1 substrate import-associated zinc metallohydrolase lipoprotein [Dysgonomonas sp. PF1-16]MDH6380875.1 substrate import-associated zinc metallohydrolase lipoprotein [Dysgonomonas sp. PFB1-18]MDH6397884.1 substrate im
MKKLFIFLSISFLTLSFFSCGDDLDTSYSIFDDSLIQEKTEFDKWLDKYYVKPYNIRVIYNYVDTYSNYDYDLIPAEFEKSKALTIAARYLWIEPYEEHISSAFFRQYAPRVLHYVGNPGWKSNNSIVLGEAEGGLRISFYNVNAIELDNPETLMRFVKTMHHEYAHIFQQKKATDPAFDQLTPEMYVSDNWTSISSELEAQRGGCISKYGASAPTEDFVEVYSIFVVNTPEWWEQMLKNASTDASGNPVEGANLINKKFEIVYNYYKESWGIDLYEMRSIVNRRKKEIENIDLNTLYK